MSYLREYAAWIWLLAALAVVAAIKIVTAQPATPPPPLAVSSDQSDGAQAAYRWLESVGYQVQRVSSAAPAFSQLQPGRDTLMVISPQATFSPKLVTSMLGWVHSGGRLVLATDGSTGMSLVSALGIQLSQTFPPETISVEQPLLLAPPVAALSGSANAVAQASPGAVTVAAARDGPVLLRLPEGRGAVWLLTAPALFDNASIQGKDNRALLLNLAGRPPARVVFDEYQVPVTGPAVPTDWLTQTVWGVAVLFGLLLLALYRWLGGWRLGPPIVPLSDRHRPLTEYVVSVAGLLQRGKGRAGVLRMYQEQLRRELKERFGPDYDLALVDARGDGAPTKGEIERLLAPDGGRLQNAPTPSPTAEAADGRRSGAGQLSEEELLRRVAEIVQCEDQVRRIRV